MPDPCGITEPVGKPRTRTGGLVAVQPVESLIRVIRNQKIILDTDLATIYQVETRTLNQAVSRNKNRFPADFMFQLSAEEEECLRSQIVMSNSAAGRGGRRFRPYAFTEHGVIMLSSVLRSPRAVQMNTSLRGRSSECGRLSPGIGIWRTVWRSWKAVTIARLP